MMHFFPRPITAEIALFQNLAAKKFGDKSIESHK